MRYYPFHLQSRKTVYIPISRVIQITIEEKGATFLTALASYLVPFKPYKANEHNKDWAQMTDFLMEDTFPFPEKGFYSFAQVMEAVEIKNEEKEMETGLWKNMYHSARFFRERILFTTGPLTPKHTSTRRSIQAQERRFFWFIAEVPAERRVMW